MSRKRMKKAAVVGCFLISMMAGISFAAKKGDEKMEQPVFGRYEIVTLAELDLVPIKAKLDTGAFTASLNAIDIEYFEKEGDDWVRFTPVIDDQELSTREMPLLKISRIKQRAEEGDDSDDIASSKRPVVEMTLCIGQHQEIIEVNLTNRGHFTYPLLLGAKSLRQLKALVDAGRKYTIDPDCQS
ncbi:ATP-dependent zinc protease [Ignatzschineria rhizosphaerae]|uniref:ATP-dependent zinc protease n=1 Tax=Ignatzschineria rhizosphaerae TaxID=2923279 RepID=A0ABY3WX94_9GAMM|nr:ATP-dependent zinc protease [Ignatzschineria rhizosphaerae]UNM95228.1 ATP-dependent zinc protease [Ignatzschineria rhizosphaerae]